MVHDVGSFKTQYQLENNIVVNRKGSCNIILNNGINLMHHSFFFFFISNKYALIKKETPKYTESEQGKRNYKQKLQESRKSIKEGND